MKARRPSSVRSLGRVLPMALLTLGLALSGRSEVLEYDLKAEFIERFTRFVEWPEASEAGRPFVIGVIGRDPFGGALERATRGRKVGDRPIEVRRITGADDATSCQLLFVAGSEQERLGEILGRTRGRPILTIGDSAGFAERGLLVNFIPTKDKIGFEVNIDAVEASRLVFSSKILRLAKIVHGRGELR